jgi:PAS domain S-box-containing protein
MTRDAEPQTGQQQLARHLASAEQRLQSLRRAVETGADPAAFRPFLAALHEAQDALEQAAEAVVQLVGDARHTQQPTRRTRRLRDEMLAMALRASPDGISLTTLEGRYVEVNEGFLRLLGYRREEVIGRTSIEIGYWVNPADRQTFVRLLDRGPLLNWEVRFQTRQHEPRTGYLSAERLTVRSRPLILAITRDITEHKRAEEALATQRRLFETVLTQVPDGIVIRDAAGRLVFANPAAKRDARVPPEGTGLAQALGLWGETRDAGGHVIPVAEWPISAALRGELRCAEWHRVRPDGQPYVVLNSATPLRDDSGVILGAVAVTTDITERKRAEAALVGQRRLFETILEQAADGIVVRDATGRVTFANALARRWAYRSPDGTTLEEAALVWGATTTRRGDPIPVEEWPIRRALRGETMIGVEFHRVTPGGHPLVLTTSAAPLRGTQGELLGAVAILTDITARTAMEDRLRQALADRETLLKEVHHRVKNNFQMLADVLFLQADTLESAEGRAALQDSSTRLTAIARVHEQLYQALERGHVMLGAYLRRLADGLAQLFPHAQLAVDVPGEEIAFEVDRTIHLGLIVNELLTNALKHAYPTGAAGVIGLQLRRDAADVRITVWDRGQGLPAGQDYRTSGSLGLRIVRLLTQRLNAALEVSGPPGTRVTIRVPVATTG